MKVSFKFNQQELGHHLLPRDGIIYTIVFEDVEKKKITDFVSFYNLPSQILKQKGHNHTMMNVSKFRFQEMKRLFFRLHICIITEIPLITSRR